MKRLTFILVAFISISEINAQYYNSDKSKLLNDLESHCVFINPILNYYSQGKNEDNISRIQQIIGLKVFDFFNLEDLYNTELKKSVFINSKEYRNLLDSLKRLRMSVVNKFYYIDISRSEHKCQNLLSDYNMNNKSFTMILDDASGCLSDRFSWLDQLFDFENLGIDRGGNNKYVPIVIEDKRQALEIEEDASKIKGYLIFKPSGLLSSKNDRIGIDSLRLVLFNNGNNYFYFDSLYTPVTYQVTSDGYGNRSISEGVSSIIEFKIKNDKRITSNNLYLKTDLNLISNAKILNSKETTNNNSFRIVYVQLTLKNRVSNELTLPIRYLMIPVEIRCKSNSGSILLQSFVIPTRPY